MNTHLSLLRPKLDTFIKRPKPCILPAKAKAVTIGVAVMCKEGIVLGADRLMTHDAMPGQGAFAHYTTKTHGADGKYFATSMAGAGNAFVIEFFASSFTKKLLDSETEDGASIPDVGKILKEELENVKDAVEGEPDISLLVGTVKPPYQMQMFRCEGGLVRPCKGLEIIGIGEMSLVQYLKDTLYKPDLSLKQAAALATWLIYAAKVYCPQFCGGRTDIEMLTTEYPLRRPLSMTEVRAMENFFSTQSPLQMHSTLNQAATKIEG